jgi:hypothetical protein
MEPFTTAALAAALSTLVNGAAGEAGKSAWKSLTAFVRSKRGPGSPPAAALTALERTPQDQQAAQHLAVSLQELAGSDHTAGEWLNPWFEELQTIAGHPPSTTNIISGNAQVNTAIQAHIIHGNITA